MNAEMVLRPAPPDLEFRAPDCPMCLKETEADGDGFTCYACEASWGQNGSHGEWFDRDEPGCASVIEWFNKPDLEPRYENIRHVADRCILPDDHGGKHRSVDSWHEWEDDDPRVSPPAQPTQPGTTP